ncbi:integrase core domain-containing protein [Sabulicella glaciei]|uniref:integrase core domain-containing protein n=1 Tax=Sabulicella glaciei TaxID=2984948 RepID=UPI0038D0C100
MEGIGVRTPLIERGCPWENGYNPPSNGKPRDEPLDCEIFRSLRKAEVLIEGWRQHGNTVRPHSALGCRPPAPDAVLLRLVGPAHAAPRHARPGAPKHRPSHS